MALPLLKLDLAPPSTLWRLNHAVLGWTALGLGALVLAAALGFTLRTYDQAAKAGRQEVATRAESRRKEQLKQKVLAALRSIDVAKELPRWRLAERILTERSLPWSRLTAELERSLVQDVRLKSLQRTRGADQKVQIKVKGEALSREAEAAFVEALQKNPFFEQVILEREGTRQGGGIEFEYLLAAFSVPPPYTPLPPFDPPSAAPRVPAPVPPAPRTPAPRPPSARPPAPAPQRQAPAHHPPEHRPDLPPWAQHLWQPHPEDDE